MKQSRGPVPSTLREWLVTAWRVASSINNLKHALLARHLVSRSKLTSQAFG